MEASITSKPFIGCMSLIHAICLSNQWQTNWVSENISFSWLFWWFSLVLQKWHISSYIRYALVICVLIQRQPQRKSYDFLYGFRSNTFPLTLTHSIPEMPFDPWYNSALVSSLHQIPSQWGFLSLTLWLVRIAARLRLFATLILFRSR